jgi:hypothetical protein
LTKGDKILYGRIKWMVEIVGLLSFQNVTDVVSLMSHTGFLERRCSYIEKHNLGIVYSNSASDELSCNISLKEAVMCEKTIYIISFVLALLMVNTASADLVAHWPFDDGSGTTAVDVTGNGNDGTLEGDPQWVVGKIGGGLEFDGDDYVDCGNQEILNFGTNDWTITAWIKTTQTDRGTIFANGSDNSGGIRFTLATHEANDDRITLTMDDDSTKRQALGATVVIDGEWYHVAGKREGTTASVYVNGVLDGSIEVPAGYDFSGSSQAHAYIGAIDGAADSAVVALEKFYVGIIDDVRVYSKTLTESELQTVMEGTKGFPYALGPNPADGSSLLQTWASLSWRPGDFAVSHDVYFGDNFDDVNDGTGDTLRGNFALGTEFLIVGFAGNPYPDGLVPGTTYYWRIDEVNDADPNSPWKGNVWSFTVPPKTAYAPVPADGAELVDLNVRLSWTPGFGAKLHYVIFGEDFDDVNNATADTAQGTTNYSPGTLQLAKTYYWRIDEFDGAGTHKGEVWSFTTEGAASGPNPADGAVDVSPTQVLSWNAGAVAASHEVYFGTDADAVKNATKSSPEYKGPKAIGEESYDPGILMLNTAYYWRIDEVNGTNPDSPWAGNVWSFKTGDFFVIDDFEAYNTDDNQIWFSWHDGLGAGVPGVDPYVPGNGTGAAVGDETTASYTEETIVHGGSQSMPYSFDNNKDGFAKYSEAELTLSAVRDWTADDIVELSIWFRGNPPSVGSFIEGPVGTYTMTASGADIWLVNNVEADEFHFAYKMLTGAGSIVARVDSVENTNDWAKAGVMIRETLDPDSAHAFACVTPANGVASQYRPSTGGTSANFNQTGVAAPYWVKLERSISGLFTVSHSANGSNWQAVTGATPQSIPMGANVYIGLALTSHDAALTCQAVFSNVTTTGSVTGQWAHQDIGILSNDAEPLYVAVSNTTGTPAVVIHNDPAAATIGTWTEWVIPLQTLADQGIVLTNVDRIAIGLGTQGNMTIPGGSGKMFFDDIRLYQPREAE